MTITTFSQFCESFECMNKTEGGFGNLLNLQSVSEVRKVMEITPSNFVVGLYLCRWCQKLEGDLALLKNCTLKPPIWANSK